MNIIVPIKQVPDLVEELEINAAGNDLDREYLKMKMSEFDDHALEEALLLKEAHGGTVTAIALDYGEMDKALFTAAAKGADKVVKITGNFESGVASHVAAKALANAIKGMNYDLVLTGVQAVDDRDGQVGVLLAHYLGIPHVSVVTEVAPAGGGLLVSKEYGGGLVAEFEVSLPAVLGIQAAKEAPRYVPVARVRQIMREATIEEVAAGDTGVSVGSKVKRLYKPAGGKGAQMFSGSADSVAEQIASVIKSKS
jgi:electron transfer flavoprotein beta subunit